MDGDCRIDLAQAAERRIGPVTVRPQLRTLARDDGQEEVIEPRVMQVLIALADAGGAVVSRDALIARCWHGRVVGEDAINRVISRLRRSAAQIGAGAFRIDTVNKVGYRLVAGEGAEPSPLALRLPRRGLILGGAGLAAAAGAAAFVPGLVRRRGPPTEVVPFVDQAMALLREGGVGANNRAIANLRHALDLAPDYADGWGMLGCAYAMALGWRPAQSQTDIRARLRDAAARAERLDPGNGLARTANALVLPRQGNERAIEEALRAGVKDHPENDLLLTTLATLMLGVGRCREASALLDRALRSAPAGKGTLYVHVQALWAAGRLGEAYRAIDEVYALYPGDIAVWFTRFYLFMHTGRAKEAIAQGMNREGRPRGIPDFNFDIILAAATAMVTRVPGDADGAIAINLEAARRGAGYAENAMQFAAGLGRLDTAFEIAEAYYFARGFSTGDLRFLGQEGSYTPQNDRRTHLLFMPSTAAIRGDARFSGLVRELGLERYWSEAGVGPDYRAG